MELFSIVVSVYNKKKYLERCLASLVDINTNFDYEVVVIDDGSSDGSDSICDKFSEMYPFFNVIHTENRGVSAARNTGITESKGDWITLVDADDYLEEDAIKKIAEIIQTSQDADVVFYDGFADKKDEIIKNQCFMKEGVDYSSFDNKQLLLQSAISIGKLPKGYKTVFSVGGACCKLIRKKLISSYDIHYDEDVAFAEDTLFSMRVIASARKIIYREEYLYHYVSNNESVTRRYRKGLSADVDIFFKQVKQVADSYNEFDLASAIKLRCFIESQRCLRNELFSSRNTETYNDKRAVTNQFFAKEPYKSAIEHFYKKGSTADKLKAGLIRWKLYQTYMIIYKVVKG